MPAREGVHWQATQRVLEGRWHDACALWDDWLLEHPRDALALQWAHLWDFYRGDAIHAFPRASFGTPQSLGCVELPLPAAAKVWPYTPIGTLVTVEN